LALEWRAPLEWGEAAAWPMFDGACGRRSPVIVFPGLAAGDLSTVLLRNFLKAQGYDTYGWDPGLNFGPRSEGPQERRAVLQIHGIPAAVSLIGWSLGGVYARVREGAAGCRAVTLGTLFTAIQTNAWRLYEFASGQTRRSRAARASARSAAGAHDVDIQPQRRRRRPPLSPRKKPRTRRTSKCRPAISTGMNPAASTRWPNAWRSRKARGRSFTGRAGGSCSIRIPRGRSTDSSDRDPMPDVQANGLSLHYESLLREHPTILLVMACRCR
jgi:hypothetical protein